VRSHTASAKRRGLTDDEITAIADEARWDGHFTAAESVALELATRLAHEAHDLGAELVARVREHWDARQIAELLMVAGQANMNNRVGSAARAIFPVRA
jgi:alkylhydroperoxidase family enzyme